MLRIPSYAVYIFVVYLFTSCKTTNNLGYFQTLSRDTTLQNTVSRNFDLKIKPDDLLSIGITSASSELSALFNAPQVTAGATTGAGYLVDEKGSIQLYKLGEIKAAGLTRNELKRKLEKELAAYLKDPVVAIRFANHRITVLGEVGSPGVLEIPGERMTVLDAIGQKGDLTENARRENILVIRQTETGKDFRRLNLLDHSIFTSPYYYLQNEDVIYVEPDPKKKNPAKTQQIISYVLSGVSILSIILSRIR